MPANAEAKDLTQEEIDALNMDLVFGLPDISQVIGCSERQLRYWIDRGLLDEVVHSIGAKKKTVYASRRALREWFMSQGRRSAKADQQARPGRSEA